MLHKWFPRKNWHFTLFTTVIYLLCIGISLLFTTSDGSPVVWPASGVILALLLLTPSSKWLWILGGVFVVNIGTALMMENELWSSLGFSVAGCGETWLAAWLFKRITHNAPLHFEHPKEIVILGVFIVGLSNAFTAFWGGLVVWMAYDVPFLSSWAGWWVADGLGMMLLTPLVVLGVNHHRQTPIAIPMPKLSIYQYVKKEGSKCLEKAVFVLTLGAMTLFIFPLAPLHNHIILPEPYLLYLFFIWSALRFSPKTTIFALAGVTAVAVQSTIHGRGHFNTEAFVYNIFNVQQFLSVTIFVTMILATATHSGRQLVANLRSSEERYRQVVNKQSDLICRYLPDYTITFVNQAYSNNFGKSAEAIIGANILENIPDEDRVKAIAHIQSLTPDNPLGILTHRNFMPDGTTIRWIEWTDLAIYDDNRQVIEYQAVGRDITDRMQAEALEAELRHEKHMNEFKTQFFSMISHEFRTPLSIILSATNLLKDYADKFSPEQRQLRLSKIQSQVIQLTHWLDQLTIINNPENNWFSLRPQPVDFTSIIDAIVQELRIAYPIDIELELVIQEEPPTPFVSDSFLLQKIFTNLISNALKYAKPNGKVRVECSYQLDKLEVKIQDDGIGIPLHDQPHLFEAFYRGSNISTIRGMGLGLVLVKNGVEVHGGTLEFTSTENVGTTFTVTLPSLVPSIPT